MPIPRDSRHKHTARALMEALEPRTLLSSTLFVQGDSTPALLGVLPGKKVTIAGDAVAQGPNELVTVDWGDGSTSAATLQRLANGQIQVWGGHAYAAVQQYTIKILASVNASKPKEALATKAVVMLNAVRGRTVSAIVGPASTGIVATVDRTKGLPIIDAPQTSLALPAGSQFAQYTVGAGGAIATFRIDWGDGTVTDGSLQSNARGNYNVLGSHTFTSAGAFRVITNVIIESADGTLLHVDMIDSSAHIKFKTNGNRQFTAPAHVQLSWTDVLPPNTSVPISTDSGNSSGTSGGVSGSGSIVINVPVSGGSSGSVTVTDGLGGVLTLNGGSGTGSLFNDTTGGATGVLTLNGSAGASGSLTLISGTGLTNGTGSSGTILILSGSDTGISNPPTLGPAPSGNSVYFLPSLYLNATGATFPTTLPIHSNGTGLIFSGSVVIGVGDVVTFSGADAPSAIQAGQLLPIMQSGSIAFDADDSVDQINADLQIIPTTFAGTITLGIPASSVNLPAFTGAVVIAPPADPVNG